MKIKIEPRKIKFRMFDLDQKKMIEYMDGLTQNPIGESLSTNLRPLITINGDICRPNWGKNCITIEFTGLFDKDGKEIYECDYLQTYSGIKKMVKFIPEKASFCIANLTDFQFENDWDIWQRFSQEWIDKSESVVIGNIFENEEK